MFLQPLLFIAVILKILVSKCHARFWLDKNNILEWLWLDNVTEFLTLKIETRITPFSGRYLRFQHMLVFAMKIDLRALKMWYFFYLSLECSRDYFFESIKCYSSRLLPALVGLIVFCLRTLVKNLRKNFFITWLWNPVLSRELNTQYQVFQLLSYCLACHEIWMKSFMIFDVSVWNEVKF